MDEVLQGMSSFSVAYIDNILVYSKTNIQEHISHVQQVFSRLKEHKVKLKMSKCNFARSEINYLGYKISEKRRISR